MCDYEKCNIKCSNQSCSNEINAYREYTGMCDSSSCPGNVEVGEKSERGPDLCDQCVEEQENWRRARISAWVNNQQQRSR